MAMNKPDFLRVGAIIQVQHWYGQIVDIAESDARLMLLITSPKSLWRHHPAEWLEFDPQQIKPASLDDALASFDVYLDRVKQTQIEIEAMRKNWQAVDANRI
jgi:hypothetical protein